MARSLSLAAWLAFRRGAAQDVTATYPPRPAGPLVWVHCPDAGRIGAFVSLAERLAAEGDRLHLLITSPDIPANTPTGPRTILQQAPADLRLPVQAFLSHWQPDILLWSQGHFNPVLLTETADYRSLSARLLVDATAMLTGLAGGTRLPGATRELVQQFDRVLAVDGDAAQRLRRAGTDPDRIEVTGALGTMVGVLPCNERERRDLAQTMGSRPVWLAAGVTPEEMPDIIQAHKVASRSAHRLLLVLVPRMSEDTARLAQDLRDANISVVLRAEDADPDESAQAYLADGASEMGLWYRLAPISFIGGTLRPGASSYHPFEAAALGSAVLHGPETGAHAASYLRLARAGASRTVRTGTDLGQAVEALLSPDKAAAMAHAAWEVTTAGADVGNRVIDLIREYLDKPGS
jgi:3-deoxy-D-manno-octulosonic-acid transferase